MTEGELRGKSVQITRAKQDSRIAVTGGRIQIRREGKPVAATSSRVGSGQCDIVFVVDTTGSMSDKIEGLLTTCQKFVDQISQRRIDWQVATVAFGDLTVETDKIVATGFSRNVEVVKKSLREVPRNSGGGNTGESSLEALDRALAISGYRDRAVKVFILLTDEPALQIQLTPHGMTQKLKDNGVLTFVISPGMDYFKSMASVTGGEWFQISSGVDFLSVLDRLVQSVGSTVTGVQLQAGGDVKRYLQLKSGQP